MTRSKVNLTYISNDSARRVTLRKRESGLMKKAEEITTLCGIDACAIIFRPNDPEPNVWPSQLEAQRVISRFRNLSPLEQNRKMVDQESFTRQRLEAMKEKVSKLARENQHKQLTQVMYQCLSGEGFEHLAIDDLNNLSVLLSLCWVACTCCTTVPLKAVRSWTTSRNVAYGYTLPSLLIFIDQKADSGDLNSLAQEVDADILYVEYCRLNNAKNLIMSSKQASL
ncbi:hypothetical protein RHSIM_Rhsim07G0199200 [Rhododendron simsii]|uniref:MADS-box domain-containing protein n=1 Tax=Rhododendron simsii TaxID=118357 RepID=A0A834LLR2_RHOSS|nr:hypothetical protein RHSIM_Rhsim07G0199200 [Rhododendron simsii]